jgi:hypothetical protein
MTFFLFLFALTRLLDTAMLPSPHTPVEKRSEQI